jgi:hypothetical protein
MFIAGHVGDDKQWRLFAEKWRFAMGRRNHLHMSELRWNHQRTKELLDRLGVIPAECGLTRVLGGVKASDFMDLVQGEREARALKGYYFALRAWPRTSLDGSRMTSEWNWFSKTSSATGTSPN